MLKLTGFQELERGSNVELLVTEHRVLVWWWW